MVRRIMNVSSLFDHRIVDGADGAALVQSLKRMLEHPALIFMRGNDGTRKCKVLVVGVDLEDMLPQFAVPNWA